VIAFGCSIITPPVYERCARVGIELVAEPDSEVLALAATGSVARGLNLLLDQAARLPGLEALIVVHEDAELLDPGAVAVVRAALADPAVAIVGAVGACGAVGPAWWDGTQVTSALEFHHNEAGGGALPLGSAVPAVAPFGADTDTLYGVVMAFSPWAVARLRCDESIGMLHGYDFDLCLQARRAGRRVRTVDLRVAHHHTLDLVRDVEIWAAAHMRAAELYDERAPGPDAPDAAWRARARAAEAAAAAARLRAASALLQTDAADRRYAADLQVMRSSVSWRVTEPLRRANMLRRALKARRAARPAD
jgi:hypothetical protein